MWIERALIGTVAAAGIVAAMELVVPVEKLQASLSCMVYSECGNKQDRSTPNGTK